MIDSELDDSYSNMKKNMDIKLPLEGLLRMLDLGFLIVDEAGMIQSANEQLLSDLGYTQLESQGLSIFRINPSLNLLAWKRYWKRLHPERPISEHAEFITKEAVIYPVQIAAHRVQVEETDYCCYVVQNQIQEEEYTQLLDLTSQVSKVFNWAYDFVQQALYIDQTWWSYLGYSEKKATTSPVAFLMIFKKLFGRENAFQLIQQLRKAIYEGIDFEFEFRANLPDRQPAKTTFQIIGKALYLEEQSYKIIGILQDISKVSSRSEDMYLAQFTLDQAKEMIYWVNRAGQIIFCNQTAAQQLGYTVEGLRQMNVADLHPDWDKEGWQKLWINAEKEPDQIIETQQVKSNHQSIPVQIRLNWITYEDQALISFFARDITEKKRRDEVIQLFQHTVDNSKDMFFWSWEDGTILFHNKQVVKRLGYKASELATMNMYDLLQALPQEEGSQYWQSLLETGEVQFQSQASPKEGPSFPVAITATLIEYKNKPCACVIWRDLSEYQRRTQMLERAFEEIKTLQGQLEDENAYLLEEVAASHNFKNIISASKAYKKILRQIELVAPTDSTVLIQGETGTGKELIARAIHGYSERKHKPLIKVNCATLPAELIESELFGHEKGAFTGAHQLKKGRFEIANGATVFLDEIGEMPVELQPKLLRVLQEGEFMRVGGNELIKVDIRLIAATNRNLEERVKDGTFREDLFYRLNVFPITNLPLRDRKEDIPLLVQHFLKKYADRIGKKIDQVSSKDMKLLQAYDFPGNIRELENLVERAIVLSKGNRLSFTAVLPKNNQTTKKLGRFLTMEDMQRQHIIEALRKTNGKVTGKKGAAALLDMNGKTLASRMKKLGINKKDLDG